MRIKAMLHNLKQQDKDRFKSGDLLFIKQKLEEELEKTKNDLISLPINKVEELRGKAQMLTLIINLLP